MSTEHQEAKVGHQITLIAVYTDYMYGHSTVDYKTAELWVVYDNIGDGIKSEKLVWDREEKTLSLTETKTPDWRKIIQREETLNNHSAGFNERIVDLLEDAIYKGLI